MSLCISYTVISSVGNTSFLWSQECLKIPHSTMIYVGFLTWRKGLIAACALKLGSADGFSAKIRDVKWWLRIMDGHSDSWNIMKHISPALPNGWFWSTWSWLSPFDLVDFDPSKSVGVSFHPWRVLSCSFDPQQFFQERFEAEPRLVKLERTGAETGGWALQLIKILWPWECSLVNIVLGSH